MDDKGVNSDGSVWIVKTLCEKSRLCVDSESPVWIVKALCGQSNSVLIDKSLCG